MSSVNTRVQWQPSPGTGILELRKEKSRDAARSRRGKENYEFYELAKMLPLPGAITSQLDKASIIRLTISYLKLRDFSSHGDPPWNRDGPPPNKSVKGMIRDLCYYERTDSPQRHMGGPPRRRTTTAVAMEIFEAHQGTHILQSLDGFAFALASDGRFLYISETVSIYLGLSQVEMTGSSMFDYVHVQDHSEVAEQLGLCLPHGATMPSPSSTSDEGSSSAATTPRAVTPPIPDRAALMNPNPSRGYEQSFCIRMKSTLTKRGVHVKTSGYRVVQILCHMRPQFSFSLTRKHPPPLLGLVGLAIALPPPTINELLIDNDMFVSRLSPDFKVTYVEPRIGDMMDVSAEDLTNKNLYDYCHAQDLQKLRKAHVDLLNKGQVLTDYYRLLNKHGGYIWLQTCATTICNAKNVEDQNIIAINYVLSGVEYSGCVMDTKQLKTLSSMEPDQSDQSGSEAGSDPDDRKDESDKKSPSERADPDNSGSETQGGHSHHTHSSSHDGTVVQESNPPAEQDSREDSLIINYHKNVLKDENYNENSIYSSADKQKLDAKNSRRKMDRPRKRKRESESESGNQVDDMDGEIDNSNSIDALLGRRSAEPLLENGANVSSGAAASSVHSDRTSVASPPELIPQVHTPTPQDLSVKSSHGSEVPSPPMQPVSPTPTASSANSPIHSDDKWSANTNCTNVSTSSNSEPTVSSSVRDLEEAMNKHLPSLPSDADGLRAGFHSELSANHAALNFHQKHKSTIQWIGSQHAPETLPASSLLRSLYANRESVIRTNVYNPRPQFYGDMQASLLTPPGSEGYKDQYSAPAAGNAEKQPSGTYTVMSGYAANPITVAMSNNLSETYTMTPPSSVSPQEKYSLFAEQCFADGSQYRQYTSDGASHPIPIKPQAYPLPAHANAQLSTYDRSTAQYASSAGYFGHAGGFPAYNHSPSPNPVHFRDTTKGSNHW